MFVILGDFPLKRVVVYDICELFEPSIKIKDVKHGYKKLYS